MKLDDLKGLVPGNKYEFSTLTWLSPFGETIPANCRVREFKRLVYIESSGVGPVPFVQLGCDNGTIELLAVEILAHVEPITSH